MDTLFAFSKAKLYKWSSIIFAIVILTVMIYYHIGFDILLMSMLLLSCWCMGSLCIKIEDGINQELIRIACGMSLIGLVLYGLLLLGLGGETQYLLVLICPPIIWYLQGGRLRFSEIKKNRYYNIYLILLIVLLILLFVYASAPVSQYDALTGHLPITMYATRHGAFNMNIVESITYTQTGVLFYGFSTIFATFGAYKAMTMFNVVLFFLIFLVLLQFSKKIYSERNIVVQALLFFSVPLFFEFATIFYVEMLPIYLAFSGFLTFAELKAKQGWHSLPWLGLLFGCAVISKLTICYTVFAGGVLAIILFFTHVYRNKMSASSAISRFLLSGLIFFLILSIPCIVSWYRYGNPVFPWFNSIFKSPYFPKTDFVDPFNGSPLGFSLHSIITMVFHTSQNIEMADGGIGVFLLAIPLIPIACLIYRKRPFIIWSIAILCSYGISTIFTYNLRYYMAIFMITVMLLGVALNIIFDRLPKGRTIAVILSVIVAVPGVIYIAYHYPWKYNLTQVSDEISTSVYSELLKEIPSGKKIFSSEPFKGDYDGYLSPNNWHGSAWQELIKLEGISTIDYISNFDYYISNTSSNYEQDLLSDCKKSDSMTLTLIGSQGQYELYQIEKKLNTVTVLQDKFTEPIDITVDKPYIVPFEVSNQSLYQITQEIENPNPESAVIRFQINWMDENSEFMDTSISVYNLEGGECSESVSDIITPPKGAVSGILYLGPHETDVNILAHGFQLSEVKDYDYFSQINQLMEKRTYLVNK